MKLKLQIIWMILLLCGCLVMSFFGRECQTDGHTRGRGHEPLETSFFSKDLESSEKKISESWMGVYMEGIKVGYSLNQEYSFLKNGQRCRKERDELKIKVSRLGGNPVELATVQESLYDAHGKPLESVLRTKMSGSEFYFPLCTTR